jgi:hypothetical protein
MNGRAETLDEILDFLDRIMSLAFEGILTKEVHDDDGNFSFEITEE